MSTATVVITRHRALVEYLLEEGIVSSDTPVISHATPNDVEGKRVIGVLPLRLASLAHSVIEVPLTIPPEMRGTELTLDQVRQYAGRARAYRVKQLAMIATF